VDISFADLDHRRRGHNSERIMDGEDVDRLARALSQGITRRGALAFLSGLLSAEHGGSSARPRRTHRQEWEKVGGAAQSQRKSRNHACPPCKKKKNGKCTHRKRDGTACPGGTCQGGRCIPTPTPPIPDGPRCGTGGRCLVFISDTLDRYQGNLILFDPAGLSGLVGADAKCNELAQAAGLPGTYKAWLSDSSESPSTRFVKNPGPYVLVDGTQIAANWTDLTTEKPNGTYLAVPIDKSQIGTHMNAEGHWAWTYTLPNGNPGGAIGDFHCLNWTTNEGDSEAKHGSEGFNQNTNSNWTSDGAIACDQVDHLFCFQQS
jgi:hypothetical protein